MTGAFLNTVFAVFISLIFIGKKMSDAAPMSQYIPDTPDISDPEMQSLLVNQELKRQMLQNWQSEKESSSDPDVPFERSGLKRLLAQRRFADQKRAGKGGIALCLWKVCPAGPWLVSKK